jgi:peptidoglycan-associated lipoprotein
LPPLSPPREEPVAQVAQLAAKESPLKDIYFDFDKAEVRPDAKGLLAEDIAWLKAHPKAVITIEGHCDERGTSEYNLGLGERRSKATRDYLVASGIDGKRIATVSYGKERPFVLGHDESAWKWNRKAHFVVTRE